MTAMTPTVGLEVIGVRGPVAIKAVIDTGFDGELCLPTKLAVTLGLVLVGKQAVELADGSHKWELVFSGSVRFLGRRRKVSIYLTDSEDALLGTRLLADCRLTIDFPNGTVRVTRNMSAPAKRDAGK
jgi:clan AA aspartic protease